MSLCDMVVGWNVAGLLLGYVAFFAVTASLMLREGRLKDRISELERELEKRDA